MHLDRRKISVSLATMQLKPAGYDDAGSREHGTGVLLDQLGASLKR